MACIGTVSNRLTDIGSEKGHNNYLVRCMVETPYTTGELRFSKCLWLPRVQKNVHSGNWLFPECYTRERNILGEERLPRVPQIYRHSGKNGTRGRSSFPSVTLGEERHSEKKIVHDGSPSHAVTFFLFLSFPECQNLALGEEFLFFLFFCPSFFCDVFPHHFKLLVQIWDNFDFVWYISLVFFVSLNFFFAHFWFEL
jgi:hypothetical protein